METEEKIRSLRQGIEAIDMEILRLLNARAEIVLEVGRAKSEAGVEFYDPQREEEIIGRLISRSEGLFPEQGLVPVFREIISACRSLEGELAVAYLGPPGTYSHLACATYFGSSIRAVPQESIPEVFEAVEKGNAPYGVVPIENSTEGTVNRTLDMLVESKVTISGEIPIRISHDLLSRTGDPGGIRAIYSHPQALAQCRQWLRKHFPQTPLSETGSTTKAAQLAAEEEGAAAIAGSFAARLYGLKVVRSQIEDYPHNYTRFVIIGQKKAKRSGRDKTSILFSISHAPGSLYKVLRSFSQKGINLTKIESRPVKERPWEYVFFLDFEGHADDERIVGAVKEMERNTLFLKVLGSYPRSS